MPSAELPDFPGLPITPYEYQRDAFREFARRYLAGEESQLIVMATGLGKSVTAALIARWVIEVHGGRVLILAHLDNLIHQLAEEFESMGLNVAVEKGELRGRELVALGRRCVVGSVATLKGKRLASWDRDTFDLILVDECHRGISGSYQAIYQHFGRARRLGFTATPNRTDGVNLGASFATKAYEYLLPDAIAKGELCKLKLHQCQVGVDLREIRVVQRGGQADFDPDAVGDRIGPHIETLAKAAVSKLGPGQTLIFAPCRHSAAAFASAFTQLGVRCASVDYKTPDRVAIIRGFKEGTWEKAGEYDALSNFGLLTVGFNHKAVGNIVLARPSQSHLLIEQILGRGTRRLAGKDECRIIDFQWIVDADKIAKPVDLFLPPGVDDATKRAARSAAEAGDVDPAAAAARAEADRIEREELARKAKEYAERQRQAREDAANRRAEHKVQVHLKDKAPVKFKSRSFDLFAVRQMSGLRPPEQREGTVRMPANAATVERLKAIGMDKPEGVSQREAESLLGVWEDRRDSGMSSLKQVRFLVRQGWQWEAAIALTSAEAGNVIGPLVAKVGRKFG